MWAAGARLPFAGPRARTGSSAGRSGLGTRLPLLGTPLCPLLPGGRQGWGARCFSAARLAAPSAFSAGRGQTLPSAPAQLPRVAPPTRTPKVCRTPHFPLPHNVPRRRSLDCFNASSRCYRDYSPCYVMVCFVLRCVLWYVTTC